MINLIKEKVCGQKDCENTFFQFNSLEKYCSVECKMKDHKPIRKKKSSRIKKISKKHQSLLQKYTKIRKEFLSQPENQYCPVTGFKATEIHHMRKKRGFGDNWAKEFNVPLLIDERYFLAVSRIGHNRIEANPEWSYKKGFSIKNNI